MSIKSPLNEIYISMDIEADGPIPIKNSMIGLGAKVFIPKEGLLEDECELALKPLDSAIADPDTMQWWQSSEKNKEAWEYLHGDLEPGKIGLIPIEPQFAMRWFNAWVEKVATKYNSRPIFAGFPASYDHMFVYVYSHYLLGKCAFKFSSWDAKSYAMALTKSSFGDSIKKRWPREWFKGTGKHTHTPLADATEQAQLFVAMMQQNLGIMLR